MSSHGTFATAVNCIDGRTQEPIIHWLKQQAGVDFVDMVTAPGVDKIMAEASDLSALKSAVEVSVNAHKSATVITAGHYSCAGNPVSDDEHKAHIRQAAQMIDSWSANWQTPIRIIGLWVNQNWQIEKICDNQET